MRLDLQQKLAILADAAKYDASCASSGSNTKRKGDGIGSTEGMGICHSYTPDGRCISLLKILMTNYCMFDCKYCINRISSNVQRARFTTDEIIYLTLEFYKRNYIEGLFLSSGIIRDSDYTMEQMVRVAKSLRLHHGYKGYIHLKTIPNAHDDLITEAGLYADRLSVNIELPTDDDLQALAPEKNSTSLEGNMASVQFKIQETKDARKAKLKPPLFTPAGQSTQMIVGATPTSDHTILNTASRLYDTHQLRRVYYSAFSPIPDAHHGLPLKNPPLMREHRLYQADWMLRFYGYQVHEILTLKQPDLRLDVDPKTNWALNNRDFFPLNINKASKEALLRIPGIGVKNVANILKVRRLKSITLEDLQKMRCVMKRARPFIITQDWHPASILDTERLIAELIPAPTYAQLELGL
jgi:putative DNA modification/repair radical SAM protein